MSKPVIQPSNLPPYTKALLERRRKAIALRQEKWTMRDIATTLGVSLAAVAHWIKLYEKHGDKGLVSTRPGAVGRISQEQWEEFFKLLRKPNPETREPWTWREAAALMKQKYDVEFDSSYFRARLRDAGLTMRRSPRSTSSPRKKDEVQDADT